MTFHEIQLVVGAALDHGAGAGQPATDAIEIATLAALGPIEYDRVRKAAAARLRVRADTLDELVRDAKNSPPDEEDSRPPEFTDESLALRFTDLHRDPLRYVAAWGKWSIWDPAVWRSDGTYSLRLRPRDLPGGAGRVQ